MEHVTLWVAEDDSLKRRVPDEVVMQIVRLRQWRADLDSSWEMRMLAPKSKVPRIDEWYRILAVESEAERFARDVDAIDKDTPWIDESEEDFATQWRRLKQLSGFALPDLQLINALREFEELGRGSEAYERAVEDARVRNIQRLVQASQDLTKMLSPHRTSRIVAYRFNAGERIREVTLLWNYLQRSLSSFHLPILEREPHRIELMIQRKGFSLARVLDSVSGAAHDGLAAGTVDERGDFRGTVSGVEKLLCERELTEQFRPYWFVAPPVRWHGRRPVSEVLQDRERENLTNMAQSYKVGNLARWDGIETRNPPLVMTSWEDSGIWEEYQRIQRVHQWRETSDQLGTIRRTGRRVPVTTLFGGSSLLLWGWVRAAQSLAASLLKDMAMCPRCGKQWPRIKGEHRRKLCDDCASGALKRVRRHRGESTP